MEGGLFLPSSLLADNGMGIMQNCRNGNRVSCWCVAVYAGFAFLAGLQSLRADFFNPQGFDNGYQLQFVAQASQGLGACVYQNNVDGLFTLRTGDEFTAIGIAGIQADYANSGLYDYSGGPWSLVALGANPPGDLQPDDGSWDACWFSRTTLLGEAKQTRLYAKESRDEHRNTNRLLAMLLGSIAAMAAWNGVRL